MKMNLANKLTILRILLSFIILILLGANWSMFNFSWPIYLLGGKIILRLNYLIAGVLFLIASLTDLFDGKIARKRNEVTDFGKVMDAIADKVLVNGVLIVLAYNKDISLLVPVIIIIRDIIVDSIKMVCGQNGKTIAASMAGKVKTTFMMSGIVLVLFENIPMEFFNVALDQLLILIATCLSIYSAIEYYLVNRSILFKTSK